MLLGHSDSLVYCVVEIVGGLQIDSMVSILVAAFPTHYFVMTSTHDTTVLGVISFELKWNLCDSKGPTQLLVSIVWVYG